VPGENAALGFAPQEAGNHLFGSAISAGPDRTTGAGARGVPQIVSIGRYDLVALVGWHPVPAHLDGLPSHAHNRLLSSVVLDAEGLAAFLGEVRAACPPNVRFWTSTRIATTRPSARRRWPWWMPGWPRASGPDPDPAFTNRIRFRRQIVDLLMFLANAVRAFPMGRPPLRLQICRL
jgi:hypothetical protein